MKTVSVLLVEDNHGDVVLLREAFVEAKLDPRLHVVHDGLEALAVLDAKDAWGGRAYPDLILLDLNLPRKSGREVLAEIKARPDLRRIPVMIFTSSKTDHSVADEHGVPRECYVVKPGTFREYVDLAGRIGRLAGVEHAAT
jgi:two-component system, chemotaxis family, response regulator Rcp1